MAEQPKLKVLLDEDIRHAIKFIKDMLDYSYTDIVSADIVLYLNWLKDAQAVHKAKVKHIKKMQAKNKKNK